MTKEDLIWKILHYFDATTKQERVDVMEMFDQFSSQNVVIPIGENRHPYADVLHEWVEGNKECVFKYPYGQHRGIAKHIFTEYGNFQIEEFKPKEPVYEWQWYYIKDGLATVPSNFYTEEEVDILSFTKIEATKRERKQ